MGTLQQPIKKHVNMFFRRKRSVDEEIKALAIDGVDRATVLLKLKLPTSSADLALRRLVHEGVFRVTKETRKRNAYCGKTVKKEVRVYYLKGK